MLVYNPNPQIITTHDYGGAAILPEPILPAFRAMDYRNLWTGDEPTSMGCSVT